MATKEYIETLKAALAGYELALKKAEEARDGFELDSDNREHAEKYDEMLDEVHGDFLGMSASRILKECDETAYRCGFNDWADDQLRGMRERDKRSMFSDFDELCEEVEEAEAARDEAQEELEEAEAEEEEGEEDKNKPFNPHPLNHLDDR
jgi:hypothetical protein